MAATDQILTDAQSVITNGPNAATLAKAIAAAGPINDYYGGTKLLLQQLQEADVLINAIKSRTAAADTANLALINGILAALEDTSTPGTTLVTDMGTVITNGPGTTTKANSINASGNIMDYAGSAYLAKLKLQEAHQLSLLLISVTDSTDSTNLTLLQGIRDALV